MRERASFELADKLKALQQRLSESDDQESLSVLSEAIGWVLGADLREWQATRYPERRRPHVEVVPDA